MAANQIGILSKLYYRSSGSFGSPTWTAISLIRDITQNSKWDIAEVVTRASRAKKGAPTLYDMSISGSIKAVVDDTAYLVVRAAFLAGTVLDIMCLTGASNNDGEVGVRYESVVEDMTQDQGSGSVLYDTFTLRPHAASTNVVQTVVVSSGAPVFTTFA